MSFLNVSLSDWKLFLNFSSCNGFQLLVSGERFTRNSTTAVLTFLSKFIIVIVLDSMHVFH